jgi:hypothetical protein
MRSPKTYHIEDSRMPPGKIDKDAVPFSHVKNEFLVIEEKIDATSVSISFDKNADITIETRGIVANTKEFNHIHTWAHDYMNKLWEILSDRYVMLGENCYAKHTIFYDNLHDYFLESDIYDKETDTWLSTARRHKLIGSDFIYSVPIIKIGRLSSKEELKELVGKSFYKTWKWKENLKAYCDKYHYLFDQVMAGTEDSMLAEGLYIKHEDQEKVLDRYKWVRYDFLRTILESGTHYKERALIPNMLAPKYRDV